ncbi:hypothetical protein F4556_006422 [Kitasatospora gansuensis]|uniref:Uncharacterized protein n=1 Tax=Kitasatospora gansuensis TaxID=258050 RepID=A0A7W7SIT4_9ACTN|nr:hypothetical protein [Kitasatospora gansuensis]MBB4950887.1 hypothetical protein [Kitasatospora gansuensis]
MFVHHQLLEDLVRQVQAIDEAAAGADATAAHGSIGLPLTRFALGRQAETGTADESAAGIELGPLAGRTSSDVLGPEEAADGADEEKVHDLRRRLAVRFGRTSAALPLVPRLLTIRLLLEFKARGSWPAGDRSWYGLLTGAVQPLGALDPDRLADDEAEAAASLAAVVLAVLDFQATDGADRTRYEQLAESLGPLLPAAEPDRITGYVSPELAGAFGVMVDVDHVLELANGILRDPVTRAVHELDAEPDSTARKHSPRLLSVHGHWSDLTRAALDAVGRTGLNGPIGAWAIDDETGAWTFVAWRKPDLFEVTQHGRTPGWRHFQLPPVSNPAGLARGAGLRGRPPKASGPLAQPTPIGRELLDELGLLHPFPPSEEA